MLLKHGQLSLTNTETVGKGEFWKQISGVCPSPPGAASGGECDGILPVLLAQRSGAFTLNSGLYQITPSRLSLFFCKLARLLVVPGLFPTPTPHLLHRHCILEMLYLLARGSCPAEGQFGYPAHNLQWTRGSPSPSNVIVADQEEKAGWLLGKGRPISDSHANVLTYTFGENETQWFIFATRFF